MLKNTTITEPAVRVALLLPDQVWAGSAFLARELLQVAGTLLAHNKDVAASALFEVAQVGASRAAVASFGGALLKPDLVAAAAPTGSPFRC